ncbi:hypothetical protein ACLVWU_05210 [Bdellovibrio sp. HCB290]|uniref:hypothetical protein n=1 Tax=Bdellovibrio sp. HCB290 TaxID=3394356 RepID=UPI0039B4BB31
MKNLIAALTILIGSSTAFAGISMDGECVAIRANGTEIRVSHMGVPTMPYTVEAEGLEIEERFTSFDGVQNAEEYGVNSELVFKTVSKTTIEKHELHDEENWSEESVSEVRFVKLVSISPKLEKALSLKKGMKLAFVCSERLIYR